ncbi:MAG: hypothetical protein KER_00867 [Kerstersia gyiorum]
MSVEILSRCVLRRILVVGADIAGVAAAKRAYPCVMYPGVTLAAVVERLLLSYTFSWRLLPCQRRQVAFQPAGVAGCIDVIEVVIPSAGFDTGQQYVPGL